MQVAYPLSALCGIHDSVQPRGLTKLVHELLWSEGRWVSRDELRALHKLIRKCLLAGFEVGAPNHFAAVRIELRKSRLAAKRSLINSIDIEAGLLKLQLNEESGTDPDSCVVNTSGVI